MSERPFDIVCMGRAAVDLYGEQIGGRLEDMRSFAKYLGGSPANTAVGLARLGLKPAMLTRVGDEHNGRFVRERLAAEGVDVGHVTTDPERLTALVFLGIRDRDTFPLVFYRDRCADMAIDVDDVDPALIASARALLLSGTHLSQPGTRAACERAAALARAAGARVVLDIDYRPVLWGLTAPGLGEQRYVESARVSEELQRIVPACDLVVGTEEEIRIAGGSPDTAHRPAPAARRDRGDDRHEAGADGLHRLRRRDRRTDLEHGVVGPGFPVEVFNVLGAGDAFMAGFLRGWLRGEAIERCAAYANACGALVVSRHGCAPAMPSWIELQHFLAHGSRERAVRFDADLEHLHRVTTRLRDWPELAVLAFDHRVQFEELALADGRSDGAIDAPARERIARFKRLVAAGGQRGASASTGFGVIVDDRYGEDVLPMLTGGAGWIARPVEQPGSRPLAFEGGADVALTLRDWPTEHVAKCLVLFHPDDDAALKAAQLERLGALQAACVATDRELLIEVIPPREMASGDDVLARALDAIYAAGVRPDWWKLPPPGSDAAWDASPNRSPATIRTAAASSCSASRRARTSSRAASRWRRRTRSAAASPSAARSSRRRRRRGSPAARATTRSSPTSPRATGGSSTCGDGRATPPRRRRAATPLPLPSRTRHDDASADRLHRHRHDGPRHGEEPARQGLSADLQGATATASASPTCSPPARPKRRRRRRSAAAPTSSSSASRARRRSRTIVCGADGLAQAARDGLVVVDTSTAEPSSTARIRADAREPQGTRYIDAPLARTPKEAEEGRLNTMVGAEAADFERIKPVLQAFCENVFHVGKPGDGHVLKLVNNMLAMTMAASIAEAAAVAAKSGLSLRKLHEVVSAGGVNSGIFQMMFGRMLEGDLGGLKFAIANAQKDLRYYTHLAETLPVPSFVAEAAHQSFVQAANLGFGDKFIASLFEAQERTAQVRIVDNVGRQP